MKPHLQNSRGPTPSGFMTSRPHPTMSRGESALAGQHSEHNPPQTAAQIKTGQQLGAEIETEFGQADPRHGKCPQSMRLQKRSRRSTTLSSGAIWFPSKRAMPPSASLSDSGPVRPDLKVAVEGFQMTTQGLRKVGGGTTDSEGGKTPGADVGAAALIATHNPVGLIVSTGLKIYGEESGKSTVKGRAEQTAKEIADVLKKTIPAGRLDRLSGQIIAAITSISVPHGCMLY